MTRTTDSFRWGCAPLSHSALGCQHLFGSYRHFLEVFTGFLYLTDSGARLPRLWLHTLCARRMLLRSMCDPPLDTGMISSASGDIGCSTQPSQYGLLQLRLCCPCANWIVLSTSCPHNQQCVSSRMTRARILSLMCPWTLRGFGLCCLEFIVDHLRYVAFNTERLSLLH